MGYERSTADYRMPKFDIGYHIINPSYLNVNMQKIIMQKIIFKAYGRVQGVFFRQTAKEYAESFGITGFAKNEDDGTVTVVAEGDSADIDKFIGFIKQSFGGTDVTIQEKERAEIQRRGFVGFDTL